MLRIGIVTGEPSGDMLGAGLVQELSKKVKNLSIAVSYTHLTLPTSDLV